MVGLGGRKEKREREGYMIGFGGKEKSTLHDTNSILFFILLYHKYHWLTNWLILSRQSHCDLSEYILWLLHQNDQVVQS